MRCLSSGAGSPRPDSGSSSTGGRMPCMGGASRCSSASTWTSGSMRSRPAAGGLGAGESRSLGDFGTPEHHITPDPSRLWESCQVSTWRLWGYAIGERWRPALTLAGLATPVLRATLLTTGRHLAFAHTAEHPPSCPARPSRPTAAPLLRRRVDALSAPDTVAPSSGTLLPAPRSPTTQPSQPSKPRTGRGPARAPQAGPRRAESAFDTQPDV